MNLTLYVPTWFEMTVNFEDISSSDINIWGFPWSNTQLHWTWSVCFEIGLSKRRHKVSVAEESSTYITSSITGYYIKGRNWSVTWIKINFNLGLPFLFIMHYNKHWFLNWWWILPSSLLTQHSLLNAFKCS